MEKKPLSTSLKYFYGVGDLGFTLMSNVEGFLFVFFLTNIIKMDLGTIAFVTTLIAVVDAILSPTYGGIMNSLKPMKWGRYRSWLIVAPILVVPFYTLSFSNIGSGMVTAAIIAISLIIAHCIWNFAYVANVSLIPIIGRNSQERAQLSATRGAWNNSSKVIWAYVGAPVAVLLGTFLHNEALGYTSLAFIYALLFVIGYYIHFKMTTGYEETGAEEMAKPKQNQAKTSFKELMSSLIQNPSLMFLLIADISRWMVNFVMAASAIYFFTYVMQNVGMMAIYLLLANFCAVIGAYAMSIFAKPLGVRNTALLSFFAMGSLLVATRFAIGSPILVLGLLTGAQFFFGIVYSVVPALYSDTVVYSEWKTGKNATGWIMGLSNMPLKLAVVTRGALVTGVLAMAGFSANIDPAAATDALKSGIANVFVTIPGIAVLVGAVILFFGYRLTKEKVEHYQGEIESRKVA